MKGIFHELQAKVKVCFTHKERFFHKSQQMKILYFYLYFQYHLHENL